MNTVMWTMKTVMYEPLCGPLRNRYVDSLLWGWFVDHYEKVTAQLCVYMFLGRQTFCWLVHMYKSFFTAMRYRVWEKSESQICQTNRKIWQRQAFYWLLIEGFYWVVFALVVALVIRPFYCYWDADQPVQIVGPRFVAERFVIKDFLCVKSDSKALNAVQHSPMQSKAPQCSLTQSTFIN